MSRSGDRTSTFDPSHSDNLLHGLNLLWRKQLFCDVTLTAQGQQFHCHKAVLASCSQYFRSLFSSGGGSGGHPHALGLGPGSQDGLGGPPKEPPPQTQEEPGTPSSSPEDKLLASPRAINNLVLQGCSSIGLRLVLEYLYTANVTLSLDTVEEVLSVSKILHIPQVTKLCVQFLNDQISVQNYKQVCKIAALHGLEETKKLANKYLVEDVLLLNFEEMRALLDSLPPPVESELALFQMSVLWLEHDRETRMQYAPDLMKRLRFALIPAPELVERVQSVDFMRTDPVCQKLLLDAMNYHLMPFRQHCRQSLASSQSQAIMNNSVVYECNNLGRTPYGKAAEHLSREQYQSPVNMKNRLVITATFSDILATCFDRITVRLQFVKSFDVVRFVDVSLQGLPAIKGFNSSSQFCVICKLAEYLFKSCIQIIYEDVEEHRAQDGALLNSTSDRGFAGCFRGLVPSALLEWSMGAQTGMGILFPEARLQKYTRVLEDGCAPILHVRSSTESAVMPYNSAHHCVVEVENFLFVLGGEDQWNPNGGVHNGEYVPWLYCYDPVMDVWARKQDMNTKRAIHTLAVMNDRLYAIGGNHLKGFSHLDVMLVECYDPKGDQWNILQTPILEGRSGPGCAVLDDSIYLVGGYSWSMGAYKSSTICYSPEKGTWTELEGDVAEPLAGPACSTVVLPACVPYNK
ncbi:hypothetical protein WISP_06198 [Willisornis vidua]|uniref:BTB domain-containing protein n=1 Tax=Willisornis vidua TaxID=1566151 RepID=A0ABQ9DYJ5_9PASS|nr:hypothetical protein WISP_06198 [Willisornis vidua]